MKKLTIIAVIILSITGCGEEEMHQTLPEPEPEWAPVGAQWWYTLSMGFSPEPAYAHMEATKDTTIAEKDCRKLEWREYTPSTDHRYNTMFVGVSYTYQDGDWVFYLAERDSGSVWERLYYVGQELSTQWSFQGNGGNPFEGTGEVHFNLDSVVCDEFYSRFGNVCNYYTNNRFHYTDLFGGLERFLPSQAWNTPFDGDGLMRLRCYSDPDVGLINLWGEPCARLE